MRQRWRLAVRGTLGLAIIAASASFALAQPRLGVPAPPLDEEEIQEGPKVVVPSPAAPKVKISAQVLPLQPPTLPPPRESSPPPKKDPIPSDDEAWLGITIGAFTQGTLFRMETEKDLKARLQRENAHWRDLKLDEAASAPPAALPSQRGWSSHQVWYEPNRFAYGRLFFEQTGPERYGRDFGLFSPLLSIAWFSWDLGMYPIRAALPPWRCTETNEGRALPGDPQPVWDRGWPFRTWRETP